MSKNKDTKINTENDEEIILDSDNNAVNTDSNEDGVVVEEFEDLDEEGDEKSFKDKIKSLKEKIKNLEKEKQANLDGWMRSQADYKNREMQIDKDRKSWSDIAVKTFAEELLIVMDTYDAARSNKGAWESVDSNWRSGIEYIFTTFENKLTEKGFEKFGKLGDDFDPNIHEGLGTQNILDDNSDKENTISTLITSGYKYKGIVIRPAKVKIWIK